MIEAQIASFARALEAGDPVREPLRGLGTLWERLPPDAAARWRDRLIALIDPYLDSPDPWPRANAVRAMANVAGPDAVARLTRLLGRHPDRAAIRAVGRLDPDAVRVQLLALLREPAVLGPRYEPPIPRIAAQALGELRHPDTEVVRELIAALTRIPRTSWSLKDSAADIRTALVRISQRDPGVREAVLRELAELRGHAREDLRADYLRMMPGLSVPVPMTALHDPSLSVRLAALTALLKTDAALEAITTAATASDPRTRELAADQLGGTELPVDDLAARLSHDPDPEVRRVARDAARRRVRRAPIERLRGWLDDERHDIRELAATTLAKRGHEDGLELMRARLSDPEPELRRSAVGPLSVHGGHKDVERLAALLHDPDPRVRRFTAQQVVHLVNRLPGRKKALRVRLAAALTELLDDPDRACRESAAWILPWLRGQA